MKKIEKSPEAIKVYTQKASEPTKALKADMQETMEFFKRFQAEIRENEKALMNYQANLQESKKVPEVIVVSLGNTEGTLPITFNPIFLILFFGILLFLKSLKQLIQDHFKYKPFGTNSLGIIEFLFSDSTVEKTFKPLIADWRFEYFEALNQKRTWKARWISVRYRYAFIKATGLSVISSLLNKVLSLSK